MVFSSTIFLFLFLPLVLLAYHAVPRRARNGVLILASLLFYFWGERFFVLVMLASIAANWLMGLCVGRAKTRRAARATIVVAVVANIGLLVAYKYADFLVANLNTVFAWLGRPELASPDLGRLPIGISFFTFQALSYVLDVYRGEARVQRNPFRIALYISMFPQLIAGPIVRFREIESQLAERRVDLDLFGRGVQRFVVGLAKKVLLATPLQVPTDAIFGLPEGDLTPAIAWLGALCYMLQLYFDFSGYSDMAIGLGRMFGFRLPENFDYPFVARSIRDIWRRWHISLTTWFRDYLYIPMGGSRVGALRTHLNLVTVFVLVGLWHGARWNFVVFGLYHGIFLVLERFDAFAWLRRTPRPLQHAYTLAVWLLGLAIFRSDSLGHAGAFLQAMLFGAGEASVRSAWEFLTPEALLTLTVGALASLPLVPLVRGRLAARRDALAPGARSALDTLCGVGLVAGSALLLAASAVHLAASTQEPFIYFRF